jgi:hypothetical protein
MKIGTWPGFVSLRGLTEFHWSIAHGIEMADDVMADTIAGTV